MNLAAWLRAGRDRRKLTIEDVARITKINARVLEKLENGQLDGLPAEVFVKGFVRSFAKCVGLDETEAIDKYNAVQAQATQPSVTVAKALVETMARPVEVETVLEARRVAQIEAASPAAIEQAEVAPVEAAPVEAPLVIEAPLEIETPVIADSAPVKTPKKKPRKNAKQRNRKRKQAQERRSQLLVAEEEAIETAVFTRARDVFDDAPAASQPRHASHAGPRDPLGKIPEGFERIDTSPVASINAGDAESIEASSIEAKTTELIESADAAPVDVAPVSREPGTRPDQSASGRVLDDGVVEAPTLAAGSQRISQTEIAVVEQELDSPPTSDSIPQAGPSAQGRLAAGHSPLSVGLGSATSDPVDDDPDVITSAGTWLPTMPPVSTTPSAPWRRPSLPATNAYIVPSLVIDDADPDSADRERDERAIASGGNGPHRLSFLPPILLDREDRSARQGGLTLAVIILLIAATLTLSYLMRRPSPSGDGVTLNETPATVIA